MSSIYFIISRNNRLNEAAAKKIGLGLAKNQRLETLLVR